MFKTIVATLVIASTVALSGCSLPFFGTTETCKITETVLVEPVDEKTVTVKTIERTC